MTRTKQLQKSGRRDSVHPALNHNNQPNKPSYNLESGWPSGGGNNGASIASPDAQKAAIADIVAKVGGKTVVFSYSNDDWKPAGVEQHFGCAQYFG